MRFVDVMFAAVLAVALVACEPPPPCPECPPPVAPRDAGPRDAGQPLPPAPRDSGQERPEPRCAEAEREAWSRFLRRPDLVDALLRCTSAANCGGSACSMRQCIETIAGAPTCQAGLDVECLVLECAQACGSSGSSERCRFCACETGCHSDGADCHHCDVDAARCAPFSLPPAVVWWLAR